MTHVDETALTSYIDGALDYDQVCEVDRRIDQEPPVRELLLRLLRVHVLLKTIGRQELQEPVPERLSRVLKKGATKRGNGYFLRPALRAAAAIALIVAGFATSKIFFC